MHIEVFTLNGAGRPPRLAGAFEAESGALTVEADRLIVHSDDAGRELLGVLHAAYQGDHSDPFGLSIDGQLLHNCTIRRVALPAYMEIVHQEFAPC